MERLRAERNRLAHDLGKILVDPNTEIDASVIAEAASVGLSLGRFWGAIAADTDPEFDEVEIDYDGIRSGIGLLLEHLHTLSALADLLESAAGEDLDAELGASGGHG